MRRYGGLDWAISCLSLLSISCELIFQAILNRALKSSSYPGTNSLVVFAAIANREGICSQLCLYPCLFTGSGQNNINVLFEVQFALC